MWGGKKPRVARLHLGVCPSNAILLRQTICRHLRRSRPETILNVFQRIRLRFFRALRPRICRHLLSLATRDYSDRLLPSLFFTAAFFIHHPETAYGVRPFITDDARIAPKGYFEDETFGGASMAKRHKPTMDFGSLEALSFTHRFELTAGIIDFRYHDRETRLQDIVIQPKVLLYESFGPIPSVSASAGVLLPVSGNEQAWDHYAMTQVSWFLFRPEKESHPYDHWLAIHLNVGTKARYRAGPTDFALKPYWAAGFEVGTFTRDFRFISETYNGDYFEYEQEFPGVSSGFRWYHSDGRFQVDLVWRGVRVGQEGTEHGRRWEHTVEIGFRTIFSLF